MKAAGTKMTVAELIEALSKLPPDMRVVTRGYEGGYDDIGGIGKLDLLIDVDTDWFWGRHDVPSMGQSPDETCAFIVPAIGYSP